MNSEYWRTMSISFSGSPPGACLPPFYPQRILDTSIFWGNCVNNRGEGVLYISLLTRGESMEG